jgi:hypothetical protein
VRHQPQPSVFMVTMASHWLLGNRGERRNKALVDNRPFGFTGALIGDLAINRFA